jgi:hypothetical protein
MRWLACPVACHDCLQTFALVITEVKRAVRRFLDIPSRFSHFKISFMIGLFRQLIVNFVHFMAKHFRHQDTKTQKHILTKGFRLCLSAFVAIFSGLSGLGLQIISQI